jgi:hypothetical protein
MVNIFISTSDAIPISTINNIATNSRMDIIKQYYLTKYRSLITGFQYHKQSASSGFHEIHEYINLLSKSLILICAKVAILFYCAYLELTLISIQLFTYIKQVSIKKAPFS